MKMYDNERIINLYRTEKMNAEILIDALEKSKKIVENFDSKVVNKRLITAIDNETNVYTTRKQEFYCDRVELFSNHYANGTYPEWFKETYFNLEFQESDSKRLDANKTIIEIEKTIASIERKLVKMDKNANRLEDIKFEYDALRKQIEKFNKNLDVVIYDTYRINY